MRIFNQYPAAPYIGQYYTRPIQLGSVGGISVPLIFNWLSYGASTANSNLVVNVDMSNSNVANKIVTLRSVYIDNTGSDVPIYIQFPDTQQVIVCEPNSTLWAPCYTGQMKCIVAGLGFLTGDIPQTYIMFTNLPCMPAVNPEIAQAVSLWKASNTITRGSTIYNTNIGVPALGDQFTQVNLPMTSSSGTVTIFNFGSGFIYLTELVIAIEAASGSGADVPAGNAFFESTGAAGIFCNAIISLLTGSSVTYQEYIRAHGNFKIDGSQLWRLRWNASTAWGNGTVFLLASYTTNPL